MNDCLDNLKYIITIFDKILRRVKKTMIKMYISGRLANDAKVFSYGNEGKTGVNFSVVSNVPNGDSTEIIGCTYYNRGEEFAKHLTQGNQVIVSGDYHKNDAGYVSCIVRDFEFGAAKKS